MVMWFLATQTVQRPLLEAPAWPGTRWEATRFQASTAVWPPLQEAQAWADTPGLTKGIWPPVSMAMQSSALEAPAWAGTWVDLDLWFLEAPAWTDMQLMVATLLPRTDDQRCPGKAVPPATRLLPHLPSLSPLPTTLA